MPTLLPKELEYRDYSWKEIKIATHCFSCKICDGGFGPIYKGVLPCGTPIAVKQLSTDSKKGKQEFENEVDILHKLEDHPNIVKLLGLCKHKKTRKFLLVFKYMENGNLRGALFGQQQKFIERRLWPYRFKICLGIAKGLAHLHEVAKVVHGDIKLSNILIDDKWNPKIADFGLAKQREAGTHGTMECMRPEYSRRGMVTDKEDTYNFGLVTLELMSGRLNVSRPQNDQSVFLPDLANLLEKRGDLLALIDKDLKMTIPVDKATMVLELALLCTSTSMESRPSMSQVVKHLEGGEPLRKTTSRCKPNDIRNGKPERTTTDISDHCLGSTSGDQTSNRVEDANFGGISKLDKLNTTLQTLTVSNGGAKGEGIQHSIQRIKFSSEEQEAGRKKVEGYLVGHFLDQDESLNIDTEKIKKLWNVQENFTVDPVGNGYFLFECNSAAEKIRILESPNLWQIGQRRLVLREWDEKMKFDTPPGMKSLPFWVNIYNLPFNHWTSSVFYQVGNGLGMLLYTGQKAKKGRGEYANLLIEFDASNALREYWDIQVGEDEYQLVLKYDWRPLRCATCCIFGHIESESCLKKKKVASD